MATPQKSKPPPLSDANSVDIFAAIGGGVGGGAWSHSQYDLFMSSLPLEEM